MKVVKYEDVPKLCKRLLAEIDVHGVTLEVMKNGTPFVPYGAGGQGDKGAVRGKAQALRRRKSQ
jgi:hypothetical protein